MRHWPLSCLGLREGVVGRSSVLSHVVLNEHLIWRLFKAINYIVGLFLRTMISPWKRIGGWCCVQAMICRHSPGNLRFSKVLTRIKIEPLSYVGCHRFSHKLFVIDWLIVLLIPWIAPWFRRLRRQSRVRPSHICTLILSLLSIDVHLFHLGPPELLTHASVHLCALPWLVIFIVEDFIISEFWLNRV